MARQKKKYSNGQSRGTGTQSMRRNPTPKDYHRQAVAYHGGELKLEEFLENLKKK
jgi:hypothetical protein